MVEKRFSGQSAAASGQSARSGRPGERPRQEAKNSARPAANWPLPTTNSGRPVPAGFTLIELLVVLVIIALLLSIVVPNYFRPLHRSRDTVLRKDLQVMRRAIGQYDADKGVYPDSLQALAQARYLGSVPPDPVTGQVDWIIVPPPPGEEGGVFDLHPGAPGKAPDGTLYSTW